MREWVWNLFIVIAALSFIEIVVPEGSMRSYLKFIFSLIILGVIVYPLSSAKDYDISVFVPVVGQSHIREDQRWQDFFEKVVSVQTKQIKEIYEEKKRQENDPDESDKIQGISKPSRDIYSSDEEEAN